MRYNIIVVGAGWYGCHIANVLKNNHNVTLLEKNISIFSGSSYYNQNRLHLGFHYPRNYPTRSMCKKYYDKFINMYGTIVRYIDNNYYVISNDSILDYDTYAHIYKYEKYEFLEKPNNFLTNTQKNIISTKEQVIDSKAAKQFFEEKLKDINLIFDCNVLTYKKNGNKIDVICENNKYECDVLIDCTYNQLEMSTKEYIYELTLSLVYKQIKDDIPFGAITIMDGRFSSLYPHNVDEKIFTLTDVEHTPIVSSKDYKEILNYNVTASEIEDKKKKMIDKIVSYYESFEDDFEYQTYFISKKTKLISTSDSRDVNIEEVNDNVFTVNCGKIYGIFDFETYIINKLK